MAAISMLNPKAEVARAAQALAVNISAAKGIQEVLKTNLGPRGTMKMLVSGAGDIKVSIELLYAVKLLTSKASLMSFTFLETRIFFFNKQVFCKLKNSMEKLPRLEKVLFIISYFLCYKSIFLEMAMDGPLKS